MKHNIFCLDASSNVLIHWLFLIDYKTFQISKLHIFTFNTRWCSRCKFQIIIVIHFFRNWLFLQSMNIKILHSGIHKSTSWLRYCQYCTKCAILHAQIGPVITVTCNSRAIYGLLLTYRWTGAANSSCRTIFASCTTLPLSTLKIPKQQQQIKLCSTQISSSQNNTTESN